MSLLQIEAVSKAQTRGPSTAPVLRDVTVSVEAGRIVAVYGERYAGKSTLLRIAAGLEAPDRGRVLFDGRDVAELDLRARDRLRREIAIATRRPPEIPELTLEADLSLRAYGKGRRQAVALARAALDRAGLANRAQDRWADLSDTDRSFAALAKALAHRPRLVVLDDPLAGLDVLDADRAAKLLRAAADDDGCAVLVAAPSLAAVRRFADAVYALVDGEATAATRAEPHAPDDRPAGDVIAFPRTA